MRFSTEGWEWKMSSIQGCGWRWARFCVASFSIAPMKASRLPVVRRAKASARRSRQRENAFDHGSTSSDDDYGGTRCCRVSK